MLKYSIKRLLLLIPVLLGVTFIIYAAMNLSGTDYVDSLITEDMTEEQVAALRAHYGLDKPLLERYVIYIGKMFQGDLGKSYNNGLDVWEYFKSRIGATLYLGLMAGVVTTVLAIPLGIIAAVKNGSIIDNICNVLGVIGLATPNFWLGLLLIVLFAVKLKWLPVSGNEHWYSVILPAFTIGTGHMAIQMRTTRTAMLDNLRADYLRTARAKGVSERKVVTKHALRNALIPTVQIALALLSTAVGGAALTESVFNWPGVGKVIVDAVSKRDIPLACGFLVLKCSILGVFHVFTELLNVVIDPRLKTMYVRDRKKKNDSGKQAKEAKAA